MEVEGLEDLPKLFISPIEKLMDEFKGSVKEFRGLFKISRENIALVSLNTLHQQICLTARDCFESTQGECNLFGLEFTKDEQISNWLSRVDNYKQIQLPSTAEGFMNVNNIQRTFNFLKSIDIASINNETDLLHPGAHMFWDDEEIRSKFMNYLATWSKIQLHTSKKDSILRTPQHQQKENHQMKKQ